LKSRERFTSTLVTYWNVDFTLLFKYPYFSGDKIVGEFGYRRRVGGLLVTEKCSIVFTTESRTMMPTSTQNKAIS